jgi:2-(1,2-epoxy-1,2-dihydrophenyl)acetyl-CoA isomerase
MSRCATNPGCSSALSADPGLLDGIGFSGSLVLTPVDGSALDAQEELRIDLVNRVVPAEQLENETLKLAERLAQGPTVA